MDKENLVQIGKLLSEFKNSMKCPVCRNILREPVELACSHSFCKECHNNLFKFPETRDKCPVCRKKFKRRDRSFKNGFTNEVGNILREFCDNTRNKYNIEIDKLESNSEIKKLENFSKNPLQIQVLLPKISPSSSKVAKRKRQSPSKENAFDKLITTSKTKWSVKKPRRTYANKKAASPDTNILHFEDCTNRDLVVKWLNDNKNTFDRITQTQQSVTNKVDDAEVEQLASVSQTPLKSNVGKTKRKRCRSMDFNLNNDKQFEKQKCQSVCMDLPAENYDIDEINTEELNIIKETEQKVLENLLEDEYLDALEKEIGNATEIKTSPSGWERVEDIKRTLNKNKKLAKQLNITLESKDVRLSDEPLQTSRKTENFTFKKPRTSGGDDVFSLPTQILPETKTPVEENFNSLTELLERKLEECMLKLENTNVDVLTILKECHSNVAKLKLITLEDPAKIFDDKNVQASVQNSQKCLQTSQKILIDADVQTEVSLIESKSIQTECTIVQTESKSIQTDVFDSDCKEIQTSLQQVRSATQNSVTFSNSLDNVNFNTQNLLSNQASNAEEPTNIIKEVQKPDSQESVLKCSVDSVNEINKNVSRKLIFDEKTKKMKYKRNRVIDSDSDDEIVKKPRRFLQNDLSIRFDSQTQPPNGAKDDVREDENLQFSDDVDYEAYLANVIKRYDNNPKESQQNSEKSDPQQANKDKSTQNIIEECDMLIETVFKKVDTNYEKPASMPNKENIDKNIPSTSNVLSLKEEKQLDEDSPFDDQIIFKLEKDIEKYEKDKPDTNTEMSDIIAETEEDVAPKRKMKKSVLDKNIDLVEDMTQHSASLCTHSEAFIKQKKDDVVKKHQTNVDELFQSVNEEFGSSFDGREETNKSKIKVLQNIVLQEEEDIFLSDDEVVESTPPKKNKSQEGLSTSLCLLPPPETYSIADSLDFIMALPPPPEFQDTTSAVPDANAYNSNNSITPDVIALDEASTSKVETTPKNKFALKRLDTSTPHTSNKLLVESLNFSPIAIPASQSKSLKGKQKSNFILSSTPGQKSIFNYVSTSRSQNVELTPRTKPCIAGSRLSKEQLIAISSLTSKRLATYSSVYSASVTHLVVNVDENKRVKDHTMKLVLGIASGIWVLSFDWIQTSLAENAIVPEEPFEVLDVTGAPGPQLSRLTRKVNPLFKDFKFHCVPPFLSTSKEDVETAISLLGGKVVDKPNLSIKSDGLYAAIITEAASTQDFEIYEDWLEDYKCISVDLEWLSKCVAQYKLLSVRPFLLCSDDCLNTLGYPQELLEEVPYTLTENV